MLAAATPDPTTTRPIPIPKATSVPADGVPLLAACTPALAVDDFEDEAGADAVALALLADELAVWLEVVVEDDAAELDDADDVFEVEWVEQSLLPSRPETPGSAGRIEPIPSAPMPPSSHVAPGDISGSPPIGKERAGAAAASVKPPPAVMGPANVASAISVEPPPSSAAATRRAPRARVNRRRLLTGTCAFVRARGR